MLRRITFLSIFALGSAVLAVVPATTAAPALNPAAVADVPTINWADCEDGALCARVSVPLDYDDPTGATTKLNLLKMSATDPDNRIGTLFVNPGGPGSTATWFARYFGEFVSPEITRRFDIVGIDPRGTSSPSMTCRTDKPRPAYPQVAFPVTDSQIAVRFRFDKWQRSACRTGPNPITNHMTTADTARDLDLIRQAVGDDQLSYYGISYGSYLGQTYAAMYPDKVRALIIDGVLDPVGWATGSGTSGTTLPFSTRIKSGHGAAEALTSALARCDEVGRARCAISGRAEQVWTDLVRKLRKGPVRVKGNRITYAALVSSTLSYLYSAEAIPYLMKELGQVHKAMFGKGTKRPVSALLKPLPPTRGGPAGPYGSGQAFARDAQAFGRTGDPFLGVSCSDTVNPTDPYAWERAADATRTSQRWFGRLWTYISSTCANWPRATSADAFRGPFNVTTSAPLLVIGNSHDPATPISGARAANALFAGSRLVELKGWGHGALGTGECASSVMTDYLVSLTLPAQGATCLPDRPVYPR